MSNNGVEIAGASELPCAPSSLHQPEEIGGVVNINRIRNVPGDCKSAAYAMQVMGLPHEMIKNCPAVLAELKAKGAPDSATCIADLMLFAAASE